MTLPLRILSLLLLAWMAVACSAHRRAGTGDLAFRLLWQGQSDLDLFVTDPSEQCIFFAHRQVESGGVLDVDCNAGTDRMCGKPIENIYWPPASAPPGRYHFWVEAHALIPAEAPLEFEVQLLRGRKVVWSETGTMVDHQQVHGPLLYAYPLEDPPAPPPADLTVPSCNYSPFEALRRPGP